MSNTLTAGEPGKERDSALLYSAQNQVEIGMRGRLRGRLCAVVYARSPMRSRLCAVAYAP